MLCLPEAFYGSAQSAQPFDWFIGYKIASSYLYLIDFFLGKGLFLFSLGKGFLDPHGVDSLSTKLKDNMP